MLKHLSARLRKFLAEGDEYRARLSHSIRVADYRKDMRRGVSDPEMLRRGACNL